MSVSRPHMPDRLSILRGASSRGMNVTLLLMFLVAGAMRSGGLNVLFAFYLLPKGKKRALSPLAARRAFHGASFYFAFKQRLR